MYFPVQAQLPMFCINVPLLSRVPPSVHSLQLHLKLQLQDSFQLQIRDAAYFFIFTSSLPVHCGKFTSLK